MLQPNKTVSLFINRFDGLNEINPTENELLECKNISFEKDHLKVMGGVEPFATTISNAFLQSESIVDMISSNQNNDIVFHIYDSSSNIFRYYYYKGKTYTRSLMGGYRNIRQIIEAQGKIHMFCEVSSNNFGIVSFDNKKFYETVHLNNNLSFGCVFKDRLACIGYTDYANKVEGALISCSNDFYDYSSEIIEPFTYNQRNLAHKSAISFSSKPCAVVYYKQKPYFFSNSEIFELSGSHAGNYNIYKIFEQGCIDRKSICIINSAMYFTSNAGVFEFSSGQPKLISEKIDNSIFKHSDLLAASATDGRYYYLCLKNDVVNKFLVYDTQKKVWSEFENKGYGSMLNSINFSADNKHSLIFSQGKNIFRLSSDNSNTSFSYTTSPLFRNVLKPIMPNKLMLELDSTQKTQITVEISYNNQDFVEIAKLSVLERKVHNIDLPNTLTSNIKIRVSGTGEVKTYSLGIIGVEGGEIYG